MDVLKFNHTVLLLFVYFNSFAQNSANLIGSYVASYHKMIDKNPSLIIYNSGKMEFTPDRNKLFSRVNDIGQILPYEYKGNAILDTVDVCVYNQHYFATFTVLDSMRIIVKHTNFPHINEDLMLYREAKFKKIEEITETNDKLEYEWIILTGDTLLNPDEGLLIDFSEGVSFEEGLESAVIIILPDTKKSINNIFNRQPKKNK
jgi:hypothetical protein